MNEPRWLNLARAAIGTREVPGEGNNPDIVQMFKDIKRGGIKDDATPWCAAFVGAVLENSQILSSRFESAKSYLKWGITLSSPEYGCLVVFSRNGGGHVGFVVGSSRPGYLLVLGGNQSDEVNISHYPISRVLGYRWPAGEPLSGIAFETQGEVVK